MSITIEARGVLDDLRHEAAGMGHPLDNLSDADLLASLRRVYRAVERERAFDELTREYAMWKRDEHLEHLGCAPDHVFDERLTAEQRQWLRGFCDRWGDLE